MLKPKFHPFPFHPFPKENTLGTGGKFEYFHPGSLIPMFLGMGGHGWEWVGMGEPKTGLYFHWFDAGEMEEQGHLLTLYAHGYGMAQMFEWFFGEPSRVQRVSPDYLRTCVFYTSARAMNAAYERCVTDHA